MECGGEDVFCFVLSWISENELLASALTDELAKRWSNSSGVWGFIADAARDYGQLVIGLIGGSFGIWKWFTYREKILHKRLTEYLDEQDRRLDHARSDILKALERPAPGKRFSDPIFADNRLRAVLKERRWDFSTFGKAIVRSVNADLDRSLAQIENRIETAESMLRSFREQRATVHLLRGAVATAEARNGLTARAAIAADRNALIQFRTAMLVPGHEHDVEAKEYEAHQLRRLGQLDDAETAYLELENAAQNVRDVKQRDIIVARAMFCRAAILQTRALQAYESGQNVNGGAGTAHTLLSQAEAIRARHAPFQVWDSIEQGNLHYLRALVCNRLQYNLLEAEQLTRSEQAHSSVLAGSPTISFSVEGYPRRLRNAAKQGLERVGRARQGTYELEWLMPLNAYNVPVAPPSPSHNPQQPAHPVGSASGDEGVEKTA